MILRLSKSSYFRTCIYATLLHASLFGFGEIRALTSWQKQMYNDHVNYNIFSKSADGEIISYIWGRECGEVREVRPIYGEFQWRFWKSGLRSGWWSVLVVHCSTVTLLYLPGLSWSSGRIIQVCVMVEDRKWSSSDDRNTNLFLCSALKGHQTHTQTDTQLTCTFSSFAGHITVVLQANRGYVSNFRLFTHFINIQLNLCCLMLTQTNLLFNRPLTCILPNQLHIWQVRPMLLI